MQRIIFSLLCLGTLFTVFSCAEPLTDLTVNTSFVSAQHNHFRGGYVCHDVAAGLDLLWNASFKKGKPWKENLGFVIPEGLLIAPNEANTMSSARLSVYPKIIEKGKLYLQHNGRQVQVLAIVHTHPQGSPIPAPRHDFQYGYMGIHNFVISRNHIYDALKDKRGSEIFRRIGNRLSNEKIFAALRNENIEAAWQSHE